MSDERTRLGLKAANAGDRREARRIFAAIVREAPDDAEAWWNLANVTDDSEQKASCLRQVLRIDPNHAAARKMLASARQMVARQTPAKGYARPVADADSTGEVSRPSMARLLPVPTVRPRADFRVPMIIIAALAVLLMLVVGVMVLRPPEKPAPTATPTAAQGFALTVGQCVTTGSTGATLEFINQTGHPLTLYQGEPGQEITLGRLAPGTQQSLQTTPGQQVRYSARADDDSSLSGGATIQVPDGNTCTVPIK